MHQCMDNGRTNDSGSSTIGRSRRWALAAMAGSILAVGVMAGLAPEPEAVARRWELQVDVGDMRMVSMDVPSIGPRKYFYMTYRVTNNSGQDVLFAPAFDLGNGEGQVTRSGRDVPQSVVASILSSTQNIFAQDQISIIGELRQGTENAKDGVVIWPVEDLNPNDITVYAAGFSGETKTVTGPSGKDSFVLRKTYRVDYNAPGDLTGANTLIIQVRDRAWIMR